MKIPILSLYFGAIAASFVCSPAEARDGQVYVELDAGAVSINKQSLDIGTLPDAATIKSGKGYDIGAVIGYDFGKFRVEAEGSSRSADANSINVVGGGVPLTSAAIATGFGLRGTGGQTTTQSLMANAMLDLGSDDGIQGFLGGGVGIAKTRVTNFIVDPVWLKDSDSGFAWQALAGVRYPVTDNVDIGLKYRFFNASKSDLVDRFGRTVGTSAQSHSVLFSIGYNFGGKGK
jgi:OmpA-OmpF porin, OOP family